MSLEQQLIGWVTGLIKEAYIVFTDTSNSMFLLHTLFVCN